MGHYAILYVNDRETWSSKYDVDPRIMTLFQQSDRSLTLCPVPDPDLSTLEEDRSNAEDDVQDLVEKEILKYQTTVRVLRERLNLMGFTIQFAGSEFKKRRQDAIEDKGNAQWKNEMKVLRALTFDRWLKAFGTC